MAGRKSKALLDSIDLEILEILNEYSDEGLGILELKNKIKLTHQNLKKHLEKLIRANLVGTITNSGSNKINLVTPYYGSEYLDESDPEYNRLFKKALEDYEVILSLLRKINHLDFEKETISKIAKEMNSNKYSLNFKKNKHQKKSQK